MPLFDKKLPDFDLLRISEETNKKTVMYFLFLYKILLFLHLMMLVVGSFNSERSNQSSYYIISMIELDRLSQVCDRDHAVLDQWPTCLHEQLINSMLCIEI